MDTVGTGLRCRRSPSVRSSIRPRAGTVVPQKHVNLYDGNTVSQDVGAKVVVRDPTPETSPTRDYKQGNKFILRE